MLDKIVQWFRTRVLLANQVTGSGTQAYLLPTAGVKGIVFRCIATMGNSADLVLSLKYADDASGTNATAWPVNVPIYENGVAQTAAKTHTVDDSTGSFVVDFVVDPATLTGSYEGKYAGISFANSHNSNILGVIMIEDVAYRPKAAA
jgi:hypothetical protein